MNHQQARIRALLEEAAQDAEFAHEVDMATQSELAAEGYQLCALNRDLASIRNR